MGEVFEGCVATTTPRASGPMVSLAPIPAAEAAPDLETAVNPCTAEEHALQAEFEHEISTGIVLIVDAVLTLISRRTVADVSTAEGKEALEADIKKAVENLIHHPKVTSVLFTSRLRSSTRRSRRSALTVNHLNELRHSVAGLNLDEEMVSLVQYQRGYEAPALISALSTRCATR